MVVGFGSALRGNIWIWRRVAKATTGGLREWVHEDVRRLFRQKCTVWQCVGVCTYLSCHLYPLSLTLSLKACWRDSCHQASHPSRTQWCNSAAAETNCSNQGWALEAGAAHILGHSGERGLLIFLLCHRDCKNSANLQSNWCRFALWNQLSSTAGWDWCSTSNC